MALEAFTVSEEHEPVVPQVRERRQRRDRRRPGSRVNQTAPRRSALQGYALSLSGVSLGALFLIVIGSEILLDHPAWMAIGVAATVLIVSIFAYLLGCIEQRLIEIRLELMIANGGVRQNDRCGERSTEAADRPFLASSERRAAHAA
jgi:Flp pilus assembly protein TadB